MFSDYCFTGYWEIRMIKKLVIVLCIVCASYAKAEVKHLKSQMRFILPAEVTTVGEAAQFFLDTHQYRLLEKSDEARRIANKSLPAGLPYEGLMTIEEALLELTSDDDAILIDTRNRLVTFNSLEKELSK